MRAWCACAALLALSSPPVASTSTDVQYVTRVLKGSEAYELLELQPSYIPDEQCSGYISHVECPAQSTVAVSVAVWDAERFPDVRVDDALATAAIYRRPAAGGRCRGEAEVSVRVACAAQRAGAGPAPRRTRSAARLRLPPAPLLH